MPNDTVSPIPDTAPVMIAWKSYSTSDEFANTFGWAAREEHRTGSMWAAFYGGFQAAIAAMPPSVPLTPELAALLSAARTWPSNADLLTARARAYADAYARSVKPAG